MLPSERNDDRTERAVLRAARASTIARSGHKNDLRPFYEHGQWWIEDFDSGAQWSVVDTADGFDFEQVTRGDDE